MNERPTAADPPTMDDLYRAEEWVAECAWLVRACCGDQTKVPHALDRLQEARVESARLRAILGVTP
jgi:hypothetical protein